MRILLECNVATMSLLLRLFCTAIERVAVVTMSILLGAHVVTMSFLTKMWSWLLGWDFFATPSDHLCHAISMSS
jgi:sterol desaturase/sphingolipid hydroxylase (fatty acid hydroxylase superfamily)